MAKPKNPPKKNPPKKNVKTRFVDGKLEPFPKRGKPKQNIRKAGKQLVLVQHLVMSKVVLAR